MVVERFELDLHVSCLHDLVDFAVLLSADKLAVFVGELNLKTDLVMESLWRCRLRDVLRLRKGRQTLIISNSMIMFTAARTSFSRPCSSKHMLLKTTSALEAIDICFNKAATVLGLMVGGGSSALNWMGSSQKDPT